MNPTATRRPARLVGLVLAGSLTAACAESAAESTPAVAAPTGGGADPAPEEHAEVVLPEDELAAIVEELPDELRVPGAVLGVSQDGERWIGAAGADDVDEGTAMTAEHRFRAASITKVFTAAVVMGLVEEGALALDDVVSRWFPAFPNADGITIRMLLSHTGGVTAGLWEDPDVVQLAVDDLAREWTPEEVIEVMSEHPPAGPPGSPTVYSNTGYILLGEIAAAVAGEPIGGLIERRVVRPLGLERTAYRYDWAPGMARGYYELDGTTVDMASMPMQALASMSGAAGAIQSDAGDLLTMVEALLGTDRLISRESAATLVSSDPSAGRFRLGLMGFCPCDDPDEEGGYSGWGHTGDLPGYFSAVAHFPASNLSVVVFVNRDIVDGVTFGHDHLDPVIERVVRAVEGQP